MKPRVLLIEDELFILDLYRHILSTHDFEVITAESGQAATETINKNLEEGEKINLIILDIVLPDTNGVDILKQLKSNQATKDIPVVLLTNLRQENIIQQSFKDGAAGYILKSQITPQEIIEYIKTLIAKEEKAV